MSQKMIAILSPAKSQDFEREITQNYTETQSPFYTESQELITQLRTQSPEQIQSLMAISPKLADLNVQRFKDWQLPFTPQNARAALFAFTGDVYDGFDATSLTDQQVQTAQQKVRILSGLYGILKPLDLIQAYRLEMKTKLATKDAKDLYQFWADKLALQLNQDAPEYIINLASNEYSKAIDRKVLSAQWIDISFKEQKEDGASKIVALFAKRARGTMARWITQHNPSSPADLQQFTEDGYRYDASQSTANHLVFIRKQG